MNMLTLNYFRLREGDVDRKGIRVNPDALCRAYTTAREYEQSMVENTAPEEPVVFALGCSIRHFPEAAKGEPVLVLSTTAPLAVLEKAASDLRLPYGESEVEQAVEQE